MSKVAIVGDASGTGTFTISAPNGNTDRTLVLPDEAGTVLTSAGVPASAMPAGSVIQVVESVRTAGLTLTTNYGTFTDYLSGSITTTSANSKIIMLANVPMYQLAPNSAWNLAAYHRLAENGTIIEGYEHPGLRDGTEYVQVTSFNYLSGAKSIGTYTYTLSAAITGGSGAIYFARNVGGYVAKTRMFLMEIAG